jgi:DNA-binding HxlR family transcriptional regulator
MLSRGAKRYGSDKLLKRSVIPNKLITVEFSLTNYCHSFTEIKLHLIKWSKNTSRD